MAQPEQQDLPYTVHADPKMTQFQTRDAAMVDPTDPPPWPRDLLLVARIRCAARVASEFRFTGGSVERHEHRHAPAAAGEEEEEEEVVVVVGFYAEGLRSEAACRAVVRGGLRQLRKLRDRYGHCADELWDAFVPPGLVDSILAAAAADATAEGDDALRSSRRLVCDVLMRVDVTNVYCEARALVLSCAEGGGAGERCPICMEELQPAAAAADDDATSLPGCSHAFHRGCILEWFHRAPNCPCCRRDMIQYLPHKYRR